MGVDFFNCDICGEIFSDCEHWGCCYPCGSTLCGDCYDSASEKYKAEGGELLACQICSKDIISDLEVLNFTLKKFNINRKDIEDEIRNAE
jgi:hypothetical protein